MAKVEVSLPDESGAPSAFMGLRVISEHHQVLVSITTNKGK